MAKFHLLLLHLLCISFITFSLGNKSSGFPDGTKIADWFSDSSKISLKDLGKQCDYQTWSEGG